MKYILKNAAQCLKCKDIIESTHVHDFKSCNCKAIFVDGGKEYLRRGGKPEDCKELSEYGDERPPTRRKTNEDVDKTLIALYEACQKSLLLNPKK